jgi:4-aminobutyrate aminotransferase
MNWPPGSHASTFGGNPISCAAALETIKLLEEELLANARETGDYLMQRMRELESRCPVIGDVRGKGLMIGVELVMDRTTKAPAGELRNRVVKKCFELGLLILGCGESTIRLCPPLVVDREECDIAANLLEAALQKAA